VAIVGWEWRGSVCLCKGVEKGQQWGAEAGGRIQRATGGGGGGDGGGGGVEVFVDQRRREEHKRL